MNSTRFHSSPAYRELLAAHGLNSFEALFNFETGESEEAGDSQTRLALRDAAGVERTFVLKRETRPGLGLGRRLRSRSRKEWRNLVALHDRDIAAAEPVALGERRRWGVARQAFILVREPVETVSVAEFLQSRPGAGARRELALELGAMIRRMHDGGLAFRDLYARHILIRTDKKDGAFGATLVNAQRAYRFPSLAPHFRWHDLATLLVTTNYPACSAADRLRLALAYGRQSRLSADLKVLIRRVVGRAARMRSRGLEPLLGLERLPPRMVALDGAAGQRAMAAEKFVPELRRLGLDSFEAIMNYAGGKSYREAPGRLTVRIAATGPDGRASAIYLKRHERLETGEWLAGLVRRRAARSPGEVEFENIFRLALAGLAAPTPVAVGYERQGLKSRSFLITEELCGAAPADDFLKREFGAGNQHGHASVDHATERKRELVRQIARLVRRFHRTGFYHRDLYLCHIFVREERGNFALFLIDLQRVRQKRPGQVGRRWLVKDLAALAYSAPAGIISRTDRVRFVRDYLGVRRLDAAAKELIRSVVAKSGRIARHDKKKQDGTSLGSKSI